MTSGGVRGTSLRTRRTQHLTLPRAVPSADSAVRPFCRMPGPWRWRVVRACRLSRCARCIRSNLNESCSSRESADRRLQITTPSRGSLIMVSASCPADASVAALVLVNTAPQRDKNTRAKSRTSRPVRARRRWPERNDMYKLDCAIANAAGTKSLCAPEWPRWATRP